MTSLETIKIWEAKQEFHLLLGNLWDAPFKKGRLIIENIKANSSFFIAEENIQEFKEKIITSHNIIFSREINVNKLNIAISKNKDFIFKLRYRGQKPMEIRTTNYPFEKDTIFHQTQDL